MIKSSVLENEKKGYGWGEEVTAAGKESIVGAADDEWAFGTLGHFSDYLGVRNNGPLGHYTSGRHGAMLASFSF